jgi:hypothetical protein
MATVSKSGRAVAGPVRQQSVTQEAVVVEVLAVSSHRSVSPCEDAALRSVSPNGAPPLEARNWWTASSQRETLCKAAQSVTQEALAASVAQEHLALSNKSVSWISTS